MLESFANQQPPDFPRNPLSCSAAQQVAMNTTIAASVGGVTVFVLRLATTKKYDAWLRNASTQTDRHVLNIHAACTHRQVNLCNVQLIANKCV